MYDMEGGCSIGVFATTVLMVWCAHSTFNGRPDASSRPLLIGPDENPRADWLHEMLDAGGNVADVITYHLYVGGTCTPVHHQLEHT